MSQQMSIDEQVAAMRRAGVAPDAIARWVLNQETPELRAMQQATRASLPIPIRVVLPWSALVSDNDKYGAAIGRKGTTAFPRLILTVRYRAAKKKARQLALDAMTVGGQRFAPVTRPVALHARVYLPNNLTHDPCNFSKCAHDAFEGAIYQTDALLHRVVWERAGIDVDRPRAEIEIRPL